MLGPTDHAIIIIRRTSHIAMIVICPVLQLVQCDSHDIYTWNLCSTGTSQIVVDRTNGVLAHSGTRKLTLGLEKNLALKRRGSNGIL